VSPRGKTREGVLRCRLSQGKTEVESEDGFHCSVVMLYLAKQKRRGGSALRIQV
jgi:hypothetical protein